MRTKYEKRNATFSDKAHERAKIDIYPQFFARSQDDLEYVKQESILASEKWQILDGMLAVDRIVMVSSENLHQPLMFTFQERFRRAKFRSFQDLTITEWNNASDSASELYKAGLCGYFLYGYYDERQNIFVDALIVSMAETLRALVTGKLGCIKETNEKQQDFFCLKFVELERCGLVKWRLGMQAEATDMRQPTGSTVQDILHLKNVKPSRESRRGT